MDVVTVNLWSVLVAGIVSMGVGAIWYSPLLFTKPWMAILGIKPEQVDDSKSVNKKMAQSLVIGFITSLVTSYLLAIIFVFVDPATLCQALSIAFVIWLGFMAVLHVDTVIWEGRPWKFFFINAGCRLVTMIAVTLVLYYWK